MRWILLALAFLLVAVPAQAGYQYTMIFNVSNQTDGYFTNTTANRDFSALRDAPDGTYSITTGYSYPRVVAGTDSSKWSGIYRPFWIFGGTSNIPDDAINISATFSVFKYYRLTDLGNFEIAPVVFNYDGALSNDDYSDFEYVPLASYLNTSDMTANQFYTFTLTNVTPISKTGATAFGVLSKYDIENSAPTWISGKSSYVSFRTADNVTPIENATLTITYDLPPGVVTFSDWPWCAKQDIFFWNLSDAISGYRVADHRPEINNTDYTHVEVSSGTGSVNLGSWITPRGSPGVTVIGPGLWRFRSYLNVSSAVGTTVYEYKLFNRSSDGTETDLFYGHSITADVNSLTPIEYLTSYARRNYTTLFGGDRLVIKINASTTSVAARDAWISLAGNSQASMVESGYYICTNPQASAVAQTPINPVIPFIAMALSILALAYHRRRA